MSALECSDNSGQPLSWAEVYALPRSIKGPNGNPVNALLGTANLILREVERHDPRAVVLCFGLSTFLAVMWAISQGTTVDVGLDF